jgi:tetratricopeptide (TPR) repeat protein
MRNISGLHGRGRLGTALCTTLLLAGMAGAALHVRADEVPHDHAASFAGEPLGTVDFGVACSEDARPAFDRALGYMHHMMYEQAREAFEGVLDLDPECAMAHWGIATTLFQPLWPTRPSPDDLQRGWREIEQARAKLGDSERERRLVAATEAFFREPDSADWWTRIRRWAQAMEAAYEAAPDDLDVAALYALSRLALAPVAEDRTPLHDEAEAVLRAVYEQEPTHPGAVHYTIHADDAAGRADRSLDIVRSYGDLAPHVPHALHMPSHIFVRLGEWPEVIEWNRRSADAALQFPVGGEVSLHYPHAIDYMVYAYLQQGDDGTARTVIAEAEEKDNYQRGFGSAFHLAAMPARYAVERRAWSEAAAIEPRTPGYLNWDAAPWAEGLSWLARGLGALHTGDLDGARAAEARLAALQEATAAAGERAIATYIEIDRLILAGWIERVDGDPEEAVRLIRTAAELEGTVEKHPITPGALLPPWEALGDLLLDLDRPAEALEAYRTSDQVWPERYNTLLGAARAAAAVGEDDAARERYARLVAIASGSTRPGVTEAEEYLKQ